MNPYRISARPTHRQLRAGVLSTIVALAASSAVVALPSCSATTATAVIQDVTPAGACIVEAVLGGGIVDPLAIVAQCIGTTVESIIAVIETLLSAQPADAGATVVAQRLAEVHTRALALKAAGHK